MIFYASQRANAAELAKHLLNAEENEHVTVHEVRGFVAQDLAGALMEAYAISKGASCKHFLFAVSLNPPDYADVPVEDFEAVVEEIEKKLGLIEQPRIVVFHEKKGRRHCHAVWLRLKPSAITHRLIGVNIPHWKFKLMDISRALFLKYGWKMPEGMKKGKGRGKDPFSYRREEYRQAVRRAEDPVALKILFKRAWETTDSKATFARFLSENGFFLAQGERRGYVALDLAGKVYSLSRWIDVSTRDLKARLGPSESLPTTEKARAYVAERMTENLKRHIEQVKAEAKEKRLPLVQEIRLMTAQHRKDRADLIYRQEARRKEETKIRVARFAKGVAGLWERATGEYQRKCALNAAEIKAFRERDGKELHALVRSQLRERLELEKTVKFYRDEHLAEVYRLRQEIARYINTATEPGLPKPAAQAGAVKPPLAAQIALLEGKISLLPADMLRQELAKYTPAAGDTLPHSVAKADRVAPVEKLPPAAQLAQAETRLALLTGDLSKMQAALESNLLSDEMRGRIRRLIEKTLEALQLKAVEVKSEAERAKEKTREYQAKQAAFNEYIRRYAELQIRVEEEQRRQDVNRGFYASIMNMSYALNGLPAWKISVMPPPDDRRLDEKEYVQKVVLQRDNTQLVHRVFNSAENESQVSRRPPIDPKVAVPNLRRNVLEVREMLSRAGIRPPTGGGVSTVAPAAIRMTTAATSARASIRFNAKR
ncbi:MAG: hypothetical protein IT560_11950 [Alphaproteobacteria bacterium]|nr:hypothetical protein [Alphaproteobacteria bacterium]